jgi:hypothetical protein
MKLAPGVAEKTAEDNFLKIEDVKMAHTVTRPFDIIA